MAITDPMQSRLQRTIFHAIRKEIVAQGYLPDRFLFSDDPAGDSEFETAKELIKTVKGYYIDIFGHSSARNKGEKECPRIVVFTHKVYDGEIGLPPGKIFTLNESGTYNSSLLPSMSSNVIFAIHLLSNRTNEDVRLNQIISNALWQRKHIKFYDDPERYIYIEQTSYNDLEDPTENIIERVYNYTAKDVTLAEEVLLDTNMLPIQKIKVNMIIKPNATDVVMVDLDDLPIPAPEEPMVPAVYNFPDHHFGDGLATFSINLNYLAGPPVDLTGAIVTLEMKDGEGLLAWQFSNTTGADAPVVVLPNGIISFPAIPSWQLPIGTYNFDLEVINNNNLLRTYLTGTWKIKV